jgi:hypothetical protein
MNPYLTRLVLIVLLITLTGGPQAIGKPGGTLWPDSVPVTKGVPLTFEPNVGQADPQVRFVSHTGNAQLFFLADEIALALPAHAEDASANQFPPGRALLGAGPRAVLRVRFIDPQSNLVLAGAAPLAGRVNYYAGNDPARWRTGAPTYGSVTYAGLYPGITLRYSGAGGTLKGTYLVAPGADPARIRWRYDGASSIDLDTDGNLQIHLPPTKTSNLKTQTSFTEQAPVAWQEVSGQRVAVAVGYVLRSDGTLSFALGAYNRARPLVIDPTLVYSSYLGGSGWDEVADITINAAGIYLTGNTASPDFPLWNPAQFEYGGYYDAFITKLDPAGRELIYSTYLGGSREEAGIGIGVDGAGNAYVAGLTRSTDFPVLNALQPLPAGQGDAFVAKLSANGHLLYSTYLGGSYADRGLTLAVDEQGNTYVGGDTFSTDFPVVNPLQSTCSSCPDFADAFVVKLNPSGSQVLYSTFLGGGGHDSDYKLVLDGSHNIYLTGSSGSSDFPLVNPIQPLYGGGNCDAFVAKINAMGGRLVYSTFLGGNQQDLGGELEVDRDGNGYVAGTTTSLDFPLVNPIQPFYGGGSQDAYVTKINAAGSDWVYSTYLGGIGGDGATSIAVNAQGEAYVAGSTLSTNFPLRDPIRNECNGCLQLYSDGFVTRLDAAGTAWLFSTYFGGNGPDSVYNLLLDAQGYLYLVGGTGSQDFPLVNPYQPVFGGNRDGFISKLLVETPTPTPSPTATLPPTATTTATATPNPTATTSPTPLRPWLALPLVLFNAVRP